MKWAAVQTYAVLAVVLLIAGTAWAIEDKVTLVKNKEVLSGRVKKDTIDEVAIEIRDPRSPDPVTRSLVPAEVADLEFDVNDADWREAVAAFKRGSYSQAADSFGQLASQKDFTDRMRAEVKPYLFYMAGESLYRAGKWQPALEALEKFVNDFKTSRYVMFAFGDLVEGAIQTKSFDKTTNWLNQLRNLGTEQRLLSDYYTGQVNFAQGKIKEAEKMYASAITSGVPQTKGLALMGQARCALAASNAGRARELAQQALALSVTPRMVGAAHLLIGEAIVADADTRKLVGGELQNALLDAVLEFMKVQLQYGGDPVNEPQAFLRAGECFQKLSKLPARAGNDDRERAIAMYNRLLSEARYRGTAYGKQAAERLQDLK